MASATVHPGLAGTVCRHCGQPVQVGQVIDYRMNTQRGLWHRSCPTVSAPAQQPAPTPVAAPTDERAALVARYGEETVLRNFGPAAERPAGTRENLPGVEEPEFL